MSGVRYSRLASKLPRFHPLTENRVFAVKFEFARLAIILAYRKSHGSVLQRRTLFDKMQLELFDNGRSTLWNCLLFPPLRYMSSNPTQRLAVMIKLRINDMYF